MAERPPFAEGLVNLADPQAGAAVISVTDEFFAPAKRMLAPTEPEFDPDRYDEHGKYMDGWESRRRRDSGHDHCILRICPGVIRGVDIDTRHFTGNYPAAASLDGCRSAGDPDAYTRWRELVPRTRLGPNRQHFLPVDSDGSWTHLRLNIFPDGGIARLRVFGEPDPWPPLGEDCIDLACATSGGRAVYCNDQHFGHMDNLLCPDPCRGMMDGWETRRRREPGNDFVILRLGRAGEIRRIEVDTAYFRGNFPARCSLRGQLLGEAPADPAESAAWPLILEPMALGPDQLQVFERQLHACGCIDHVRFDIYPDGGVARLRLIGSPA